MEDDEKAPLSGAEHEMSPQDLLARIVLAEMQGRPLIPTWYTLRLLPFLGEAQGEGRDQAQTDVLF